MIQEKLLIGSKVRLTALAKDDLPIIARWQQNDLFLRLFDAVPAYPKTRQTLEQWLEERHKANDGFLFAIRSLENDDLLGYLEVEGILWTHQTGWISIAIGKPELWGKGYGREGLELALGFAFRELNLYRVQLSVFSYNERAIGLYEKLGFQREGVCREFLHRDDTRYDMIWYGLLRREWEERRG
jgi:RimJ/RimL family protein N-acetyltransferase